jgi:hypothetical protein
LKLYEIDEQLESLLAGGFLDEETGEVLIDMQALESLQIARDKKIEGVIKWYKGLVAEAEAFKSEINALAIRKKSIENKAESLKNWLDFVHENKSKVSYGTCSLSWRDSVSVKILSLSELPTKYIVETITESPDKVAIKEALKNGEVLAGAELETKQNIQIK